MPGGFCIFLGAVLFCWTDAPVVSFEVDVTSCGQEIPSGGVGELRQDLRCGSLGPGVLLADGATLNFNGFAIVGGGTGGNSGVSCGGRRCTINGPGEIRRFAVGVSGIDVRITNLRVRSNSEAGVSILGGVLEISHVVANHNGIGIFVPGGRRLQGRDVEANNNDIAGIWASGARVKLSRLTATRNGTRGGVFLGQNRRPRPLIVDSAIVDNAGLDAGYDVLAVRPTVRLVNSTCHRGAIVREVQTPPGRVRIIGSLGCRDD